MHKDDSGSKRQEYYSKHKPTEELLGTIQALSFEKEELKTALDKAEDRYRTVMMSRYVRLANHIRNFCRGVRGGHVEPSRFIMHNAADCDNLGDDLLIKCAQEYFAAHIAGATFQLSTREPKISQARADVVMVGPGGLIYDFDEANVDNYCEAIEHANHLRKPIYLIGIGTQNVTKRSSLLKYKNALNYATFLNVRDQTDADFLLKNGLVDSKKLIVTADYAFLRGFAHHRRKGNNGHPKLLLSFADWQLGAVNYNRIEAGLDAAVDNYKNYAIRNIRKLTDRYDVTILAQAREDKELAKLIHAESTARLVVYELNKNFDEVIRLYNEADIVISSRYHGFILGVTSGALTIPVVLPGSKTDRLVDGMFPTLARQKYTVKEFVEQDILTKLKDSELQLNNVTRRERKSVEKSFRHLSLLVRSIKDYLRTS